MYKLFQIFIIANLITLPLSSIAASESPNELTQSNEQLFSKEICASPEDMRICEMVEGFAKKMQEMKKPCDGIHECITGVTYEAKTITINQWNPTDKEQIAKDAAEMNVQVANLTAVQSVIGKTNLCRSSLSKLVDQGAVVNVNYTYSDNSPMYSVLLDSCNKR